MKTIGIKLADGSFYPILEEGDSKKRILDLTTAKDNQDEVHIDLYRFDQSDDGEITNEEYVDTLTVPNLNPHPNGEPNLHLSIGLDENNNLTAEVVDGETGTKRETEVKLAPLPQGEAGSSEFSISEPESDDDASELSDQLSSSDMTLNPLEEPSVDDAIIEDESSTDDTNEDSLSAFGDDKSEDAPTDDSTLDALNNFDADSLGDLSEEKSEDAAEDSLDDSFGDSLAEDSLSDDTSENSLADDSLDSLSDDTFGDDKSEDAPTDDSTLDALNNFDADSLDDSSGEKNSEDDNLAEQPQSETKNDFDTNEEISMDVDFEDNDKKDDSDFSENETKAADSTEDEFSMKDLDDMNFEEDKSGNNDDLFADMPDFDNPETSSADKNADDPFGSDGFSDLYDNNENDLTTSDNLTFGETEDDDFDDDDEKRSGVPLILCILCVVICILLTLFLLFIYPSKYNLLGKTTSEKIQKTEKTEKTEKIEKIEKTDGTDKTPVSEKATNDDIGKKAAEALAQKAQEEAAKSEANDTPASLQNAKDGETAGEPQTPPVYSEMSDASGKTADSEKADSGLVDAAEAEAKAKADAEKAKASEDAKEAPSSQEDKIVIAPDASKVVPVSKSELTDRKEDIRHSVKWGDTLWDLSDTYYKNPWKYPVISDYNKIPNPDYIQAGKDLLIPFK